MTLVLKTIVGIIVLSVILLGLIIQIGKTKKNSEIYFQPVKNIIEESLEDRFKSQAYFLLKIRNISIATLILLLIAANFLY